MRIDDKFHDECGLMGVWGHREASNLCYLGLYSQQHRGQEGAGVVSLHRVNGSFRTHRGLGLVSEVFSDYDFTDLIGDAAIGHVRYTTAGGNTLANVQPFCAEVACGRVAVAHNGNLVNIESLRDELIQSGAIFSSTSDTEVFLHLLARSQRGAPLTECVIQALASVKGAFSLLFLFEDRMIAVRDPAGLRPLALGTLGSAVIVASETCAFDLIGAKYLRDVEPGEVVEIRGNGEIKSYFPFGVTKESPCIFEYVYFARPDSRVFGRGVYPIRRRMGQELAREHPAKADIVIPVPDSGVAAALGYAAESGIPFEMGLVRNHYVGRTFIEPKQSIRDFGVKVKLNPNIDVLKGKSVVVIDDSIVRGTTSKKIVAMLRASGVAEVHMRISAPPTIDPCYYGIDTPNKEDLIAASMSVEEIREFIGVESLGYLSLDGLYRAVGASTGKMCDACFSGNYPVGIPSAYRSKQLQLFKEVDSRKKASGEASNADAIYQKVQPLEDPRG